MTKQTSHSSGNATLTNAAEGVILTCAALPSDAVPGTPVRISGYINITAGTSTTAVVVKIRQGSTTGGTQVGNSITHTLAAGATASIYFDVIDNSQISTGYCITGTQTAGAANGTVNDASITVEYGSY